MSELKRTRLYNAHLAAKASMVDFGGWEMPIQYPSGIVAEHLYTRQFCGIFDIRDNNHTAVSIIGTYSPYKLDPAHQRHTDIGNEDIGTVSLIKLPARFAVFGFADQDDSHLRPGYTAGDADPHKQFILGYHGSQHSFHLSASGYV